MIFFLFFSNFLLNFIGTTETNLIRLNLQHHYISKDNRLLISGNENNFTEKVNNNLVAYSINVSIGSNNQQFQLMLETLTQWTWVVDTNLQNSIFSHQFSCSDSLTCILNNSSDTIQNKIGNLSGYLVNDTLSFDNSNKITGYQFLIVNSTNFSSIPGDIKFDGGISLTQTAANQKNSPCFIDLLFEQNIINNKIFSLYLTTDFNGNDTYSKLIIGGYDPNFMIGNYILYMQIINQTHWGVYLNTCFISNYSFRTQANSTIFDISSPLIQLPTSDYKNLLGFLNKFDKRCSINESYCNCTDSNDVNTFSVMTLSMSANAYEIILHSYQYMLYDGPNQRCIVLISDNGQNCSNNSGCSWILGIPLMKNYYTIFNIEEGYIGLVPARSSYIIDQYSDFSAKNLIRSFNLLLLCIFYLNEIF